MAKENLETKAGKAILNIDNKVSGIYDAVTDLSLKLCHIIKSMGDYYKRYGRNKYY